MARWRIVVTGLVYSEGPDKSVGHVEAAEIKVMPSGVLCFLDQNGHVIQAFGEGSWKNCKWEQNDEAAENACENRGHNDEDDEDDE